MNKINTWFFLFIISRFSLAQVDIIFLNHLIKNNCDKELKYYLSIYQNQVEKSDTINYLLCKYYFLKDDDKKFFFHFKNCTNLVEKDTVFLNGITFKYSKKFDTITQKFFSYSLHSSSKNYQLLKDVYYNKPISFSSLDEKAIKSYHQWQKSLKKSPVIAGFLSALIPGSGKIYIGKPYSGSITFLSSSILFITTYESISSKGIYHPLSILNTMISTTFYITNIYGSINDLQDIRLKRYKQFIYDLTESYNHHNIPNIIEK